MMKKIYLKKMLPLALYVAISSSTTEARDLNIDIDGQSLLFIQNSTGNAGIGTAIPSANLHVGHGAPALGVNLSGSSALIKGNLEVDGKLYGDGSHLSGIPTTLSLTPNYAVKMGTTNLNNSLLYDDGANIGIGTTAPKAKLEVDGMIYVNGNIGVGTAAAQAVLDVLSPEEQLRLEYDSSNYATMTVNNAGDLVWNAVGTNPEIDFIRSGTSQLTLTDTPYIRIMDTGTSLTANDNKRMSRIYGTIRSTATTGTGLSLATIFAPTTASTMTAYGLIVEPTIDYSAGGTGSYEGVRINIDETSLPTGTSYLLRAGTGGAGFASKFDITNTGNTGIGTTTPNALLQVGPTAPAVPAGSAPASAIKGNIVVDGEIYGDGTTLTGIVTTSGISQNYALKMGASGTASSIIYDAGSNIGLGTTTPNASLEIQASDTAALMVSSSATTDGDHFIITSNGNVGIGSARPSLPLDILARQSGTETAITLFRNAGTGARPQLRVYGYSDQYAYQTYGILNINTSGQFSFDNSGSGPIYMIKPMTIDNTIYFPSTRRHLIERNTTNGAFFWGLGYNAPTSDGRNLIIANVNSLNYNFNHPVNVEPTLYVHSSNNAQPQWISFTHNQTNGVLATGAGHIVLSPDTNTGIGTTTPNATLEIQKNATTPPLLTSSSGNTDGDYLNMTSDGNMGIGSTAPGNKLAANGTVYVNGNVGIGSAIPDANLAILGAVVLHGQVVIDLQ